MTLWHSLSVRLLLITVVVILCAEALVFLPGLVQERRAWLWEHLRDADIAAVAVSAAPNGIIPAPTRDALLSLSSAELIRLDAPEGPVIAFATGNPHKPKLRVDLRTETVTQGLVRGITALFQRGNPRLLIIGPSPRQPQTMVEMVVPGHLLADALRAFARANITEWLVIAGATGILLYLALMVSLIRPLRRMTSSITEFRSAPERPPSPRDEMASRDIARRGDEISIAARELAAMQAELRTALWRNARLAVLGTALAKVIHDLRGILASAMLAADRLNTHADPAVQRLAGVVVTAVERASELLNQTLSFVREGPPPLTLERAAVNMVVAEAAEGVPDVAVETRVPAELETHMDRLAISRVLTNLLRNAQQAGATAVSVSARCEENQVVMFVADNGPGIPPTAQAGLFRAFGGSTQANGTGLGLAIARDLMRAHGGDITLEATGQDGTTFRLTLPLTEHDASGQAPVARGQEARLSP
jgi:signal transduction histidine kinase